MGACDGCAAYYGKWDNFADAASKELKAEAVAEKEASEKCVLACGVRTVWSSWR